MMYSTTVRRRAAELAQSEGIAITPDHEPLWAEDVIRVAELRAYVHEHGLEADPPDNRAEDPARGTS